MSRIVAVIVKKSNAVLMARRKQREGSLHWQFPSGAVDEGESEFSAAEREIFEETDVKCKAVKILGERIHPVTGKNIVYVLCDYVSGRERVKDSEELDRVEWMMSEKVFENVTSGIFQPVKDFLNTLANTDD